MKERKNRKEGLKIKGVGTEGWRIRVRDGGKVGGKKRRRRKLNTTVMVIYIIIDRIVWVEGETKNKERSIKCMINNEQNNGNTSYS